MDVIRTALALLAFAAFHPSVFAEDPQFRIKPYVQGTDSGSAAILWKPTGEAATGTVEYGPTPAYGAAAPGEIRRNFRKGRMRKDGAWVVRARLSGLQPDTLYHYRVVLQSGASEDRTFRTAPEGDAGTFTFVAFGDSQGKPQTHERMTSAAARLCDPAFALHMGDAVHDPVDGLSDFEPSFLTPIARVFRDAFGGSEDKDRQWVSDFFAPCEQILRGAPCFVARGNDDRKNRRAPLYFEGPGGAPAGEHYSFDWGPAHFVTINTNRTYKPGSEQYMFLDNDLSSSTKPFKVFFAHHPGYSSGRHGSSFRIRKYLQPLFEAHGVSLVLSGHDHSYQRTIVNGITYVVVPSAGEDLYSQANRRDNPAGLVFVKAHGFVQFVASPDALSLTAWTVDDGGNAAVADRADILP